WQGHDRVSRPAGAHAGRLRCRRDPRRARGGRRSRCPAAGREENRQLQARQRAALSCDCAAGPTVRISVIGALTLWNQRRKIRGSVSRDLLRAEDPAPWLADAASTLHLRTSCPHPAWLVHCAYWAEVRQADLLSGVLRG